MSNKKNSVFMVGWEYPPYNSGGLGVACEGLTQALSKDNTDVHFSLPYNSEHVFDHMTVHHCVHENWKVKIDHNGNPQQKQNNSLNTPPFLAYTDGLILPDFPDLVLNNNSGYSFDLNKLRKLSGNQLEKQVAEYAEVVGNVGAKESDFDVIHAHDWMSFPAGQQLKQKTGKPLITHVHSTEYDRSGLSKGNQYIEAIEYAGMHQADHIITVSYYTKKLLEQRYGVDPNKISVVHNGISNLNHASDPGTHHFAPKRPVIAFMGRLTIQKGVSYFLDLAQAVLKKIPNALFVVAGNGDMYHELLIKTAANGLSASVVFSGFVRDEQKRKLLNRADVFVMPSLSEPFGLVALEAAQMHTPVIVSTNAGVSEVLPSAIKLDFWDINKMTSSIVELVTDKSISKSQVSGQLHDLSKQTWQNSAQKIKNVYKKAFLGGN
jgi:glycogen(starch) synthase